MTLHSLGLAEARRKSNVQLNTLGLATGAQLADAGAVRETNTAAAAASVVPRPAAPVVGVERAHLGCRQSRSDRGENR